MTQNSCSFHNGIFTLTAHCIGGTNGSGKTFLNNTARVTRWWTNQYFEKLTDRLPPQQAVSDPKGPYGKSTIGYTALLALEQRLMNAQNRADERLRSSRS